VHVTGNTSNPGPTFSLQLLLYSTSHNSPHTAKMTDAMGSAVTIDNFTTQMSSFDPNRTENHLYGLVDMGRYFPMPTPSRKSRSNDDKQRHPVFDIRSFSSTKSITALCLPRTGRYFSLRCAARIHARLESFPLLETYNHTGCGHVGEI
jgi:hypothetical protein